MLTKLGSLKDKIANKALKVEGKVKKVVPKTKKKKGRK